MNPIIQNPNSRMARLKLMKDLKYGKVHLRQSLIQLSEFEDVNKIFRNRKEHYSIYDQQVDIGKQQSEENQEEINILISPIERIQMYRKEKMSKKLNEKMIQGSYQKQISRSRPRIPKTTKMLNKFENKYKNQMPVSYKQQLRESELNLEKIKRNDKTKFQINNQNCRPLYQSRSIQSSALLTQVEQENPKTMASRKRFMSLKTSLPEKEKFVYPSLREIMQGKIKEKYKGPVIDIKNIENTLDNYLNQSIKKMRIKIQREIDGKNTMVPSPAKLKSQATHYPFSQGESRKRVHSNVERSFTRSEQTSKKMIDTMSSFYEAKHEKKDNFNRMFKNLKYDRPLTSSIRRKNYTVLGKESLNPIQNYREMSEVERKKIRQKNYQFYMKLIRELEMYHQQEIQTTVYIMEQIKRIFETEYIFTQKILQELLQNVSTMDMDHKTQQVISQVAAFVGYTVSFTEHEHYEKSNKK